MYGSSKPPEYDLESLRTNLANVQLLLITGENDALVADSDFALLTSALPINSKTVRVYDYNHCDYMWAADVHEFVNPHVLDFIKNF